MELSVSILGIKDDIEKIKQIEHSKANYLHLDIMDGKFVSNKIDMFLTSTKPLDVHLMVEDVPTYIDMYKRLNPIYITFHIEALKNPSDMIEFLHKQNIKVGISICPDTDIDRVLPYLNKIDLVLVMSVTPGQGGQLFKESILGKIDKLYDLRKQFNYQYKIEVDGGINDKTISLIQKADIAVVGSYITNSNDYANKINELINN